MQCNNREINGIAHFIKKKTKKKQQQKTHKQENCIVLHPQICLHCWLLGLKTAIWVSDIQIVLAQIHFHLLNTTPTLWNDCQVFEAFRTKYCYIWTILNFCQKQSLTVLFSWKKKKIHSPNRVGSLRFPLAQQTWHSHWWVGKP